MSQDIRIEAIRSFSDLDSIEPYWRQWESHPNTLLGHFQLVCELRDNIVSPLVLVAYQKGQPEALLVGRLERITIGPRIGYLSPFKFSASAIVILHSGLLGKWDQKIAEAFITEMNRIVRADKMDLVRFSFLQEDSPLYSILKESHSERHFSARLPWNIHWEMKIPSEPGFLINRMKSKHRSSIRRNEKRLEENYSGRMTWTYLKTFDDVGRICGRMEPVASMSYQRGLNAGFIDDLDHRARLGFYAKSGMLRIQTLEIDGEIKAFWIGVLIQGVFHSSETAYDSTLRDYGVGTLVFFKLVDSLIAEGTHRLDFGLGDADYKSRFGDRSWRERSYHLFAPSIKGRALDTVTLIVGVADRLARRLVESLGVLGFLKTAWRRRIARKR